MDNVKPEDLTGGVSRPMTPEELVAYGYPADFHSLNAEQKQVAIRNREEAIRLSGGVDKFAGPQYPLVTQYEQTIPQGKVKQARDKAQYVRQQKGHSLVKHLLLGWIVLWIPAIYYTASPNHYWHA